MIFLLLTNFNPLGHRDVFVEPSEEKEQPQPPPQREGDRSAAGEHRIDRADQAPTVIRLEKNLREVDLVEILDELPINRDALPGALLIAPHPGGDGLVCF